MSKGTAQVAADVIAYDREWLSANPGTDAERRPRRQGEFGPFEREADELHVQTVVIVEHEGEHFRIGRGRGLMMVSARLDSDGNPIIRLLAATPGIPGLWPVVMRRLSSREIRGRGLKESTALVKLEYWEPDTGAGNRERTSRQGPQEVPRRAGGGSDDS